MLELTDFIAVDGLPANDSPHRFDAVEAWAEYHQRPEVWDERARVMTQAEGRVWDAVDAIVASVGPWWVPEPAGD